MRVLLYLLVCCAMPLLCASQQPSDSSGLGTIHGFLKTAYARIEDADTKSLAIGMHESYRALCKRFGARVVGYELRKMFESQRADLEISVYRLKKVGVLLRRLQEEADDDDDDGDDLQMHQLRMRRMRTSV